MVITKLEPSEPRVAFKNWFEDYCKGAGKYLDELLRAELFKIVAHDAWFAGAKYTLEKFGFTKVGGK